MAIAVRRPTSRPKWSERRGRARDDVAEPEVAPQPWFVQVPFVDHATCPCGCAARTRRAGDADDNGLAPVDFEGFCAELARVATGGAHHEEMVRRTNARGIALPTVPVRGRVEEAKVLAVGVWAGHRYVLTGRGVWWLAEPEVYPFPKQWLRPLRAVGEISP